MIEVRKQILCQIFVFGLYILVISHLVIFVCDWTLVEQGSDIDLFLARDLTVGDPCNVNNTLITEEACHTCMCERNICSGE